MECVHGKYTRECLQCSESKQISRDRQTTKDFTKEDWQAFRTQNRKGRKWGKGEEESNSGSKNGLSSYSKDKIQPYSEEKKLSVDR